RHHRIANLRQSASCSSQARSDCRLADTSIHSGMYRRSRTAHYTDCSETSFRWHPLDRHWSTPQNPGI
uniref:Uncharacterized protein n=1 Tax=Parascaris univalens TaxID=6257 RepID=A0A915CD14_PARUN